LPDSSLVKNQLLRVTKCKLLKMRKNTNAIGNQHSLSVLKTQMVNTPICKIVRETASQQYTENAIMQRTHVKFAHQVKKIEIAFIWSHTVRLLRKKEDVSKKY